MPADKSTKAVASIDTNAIAKENIDADQEALRQQLLDEQLARLLRDRALQEINLNQFLEQLKSVSKELWKTASSKPIVEIARTISGVDRLERRLKSKRKSRRSSPTPTDLDELKNKILAFLKSSNEGQRIGQLSESLSLEPSVLNSVLLKLRASGQVTTQGERRFTRYLLA